MALVGTTDNWSDTCLAVLKRMAASSCIKVQAHSITMADFFSGLTSGNIRGTGSTFGGGPLPTESMISNGPPGINADPDGVYSDAGGLFSGIVPYAGPKKGRMGSDKQYQQIPHRMQHIIHELYVPYADKRHHELVPVSHAVDQGDVAFVINTQRIQGLLYNELVQRDAGIAQAQMPSRNAFANLATVNYLLAGLQRLQQVDSIAPHNPWKTLALDLSYKIAEDDASRLLAVLRLVRDRFLPYGICAGSEHQGGKHETGLAPVQSAANHITTMTIDGQNRDLVNLWRRVNVNAGDELIFRLEYLPTQSFTLNHYYKGTVHQTFPEEKQCWQLVPDVFRMNYDPDKFEGRQRFDSEHVKAYDYRLHGYWKIGQCFQHRARLDATVDNYSNDRCFLSGQLLQITFAPVWCEFDSLQSTLKTRVTHAHNARTVSRRDLDKGRSSGPRRTLPVSVLNAKTHSTLGPAKSVLSQCTINSTLMPLITSSTGALSDSAQLSQAPLSQVMLPRASTQAQDTVAADPAPTVSTVSTVSSEKRPKPPKQRTPAAVSSGIDNPTPPPKRAMKVTVANTQVAHVDP